MNRPTKKRIADNVYRIGEVVYFRYIFHGRETLKRAPLQGMLAIQANGRPTPDLKKALAEWIVGIQNEAGIKELGLEPKKVPTFEELIAAFEDSAAVERVRNGGRPSERSVRNVKGGAGIVIRGCGLTMNSKVTELTREVLDKYIVAEMKRDDPPERVTLTTYVWNLQTLTARWTEDYYRRKGMLVPKFDFRMGKTRGRQYKRPGAETVKKAVDWYRGLEGDAVRRYPYKKRVRRGRVDQLWQVVDCKDRRFWLAATMMMEFAVRSSDVLRMTRANFRELKGKMFLDYIPHKTMNSSGREVCWPISDGTWQKIVKYAPWMFEGKEDALLIPDGKYLMGRMNADLRAMVGFDGGKAGYELRKMCIDHVYQKLGVQMAVSLSGDDLKTMCRYYADPQAVHGEAIDVAKLME